MWNLVTKKISRIRNVNFSFQIFFLNVKKIDKIRMDSKNPINSFEMKKARVT